MKKATYRIEAKTALGWNLEAEEGHIDDARRRADYVKEKLHIPSRIIDTDTGEIINND